MNRIWVRLTLAFLAVALVVVIFVAVLAGWSTGDQFHMYVAERNQAMATALAGTATAAPNQKPQNAAPIGQPPFNMMGRPRDDRFPPGSPPPRSAEDRFLDRLYVTLIFAALAAGGIGMVLGVGISRTIAAPLAGLSNAAHDFAARKWDRRVVVQGTDEVADVARAFNSMADALQRGEILRRNLMADIAHELRTPLTVMQGNLRALLDGIYPLDMREVATLYDETRLLSRLVADLRELALAEAGQLPLNMQTVELRPALSSSIEKFALVAEAQETTIEFADTPMPNVYADPDRLVQVMHNLVGNALRYTAGGKVTVSTGLMDNLVRIRVTDTGTGIAPEDLPHIFDRFYRGDDSRAGSNTGLGLAIAKTWVEAMGGTIGVESNAGTGSTFWFTLQLAKA